MTDDEFKKIAREHGPAVLIGATAAVLGRGVWELGKALFSGGSNPSSANVPLIDLNRQGLAAVYIFDPGGRMHSIVGTADVYCDGLKVAALGTAKYLQLLLVPGEHTFRSIKKSPVVMTLDYALTHSPPRKRTQSDESYRIPSDYRIDLPAACPQDLPIPPETGADRGEDRTGCLHRGTIRTRFQRPPVWFRANNGACSHRKY